MGDWLTRARKALSTLAYVAVTTIAILYVKAEVRLWLIVGLAVSVLGYASAPYVRKFVAQSLAYPRLEAEVTELRAEVAELRADVDQLRTKSEALGAQVAQLQIETGRRYEDGIDEGKMQWIGASQAQRAGDPPRLVELAPPHEGGELVLLGEYGEGQSPIPRGSRYEVRFRVSGERQGVVQVMEVRQFSHLVEMVCVDRVVPEFWAQLEIRAYSERTPPDGLELAPMIYPLPRALAQPGE